MKTIVDHFDPRIYEHLEAWREFNAQCQENHAGDCRVFAEELGFTGRQQGHWPDGWGPLILKKMADAWLDQHLGGEPAEDTDAAFDAAFGSLNPDKPVAGDLRVPRLRRGGGETPR